MLAVVLRLHRSAAVGLAYGATHAVRHLVGIHYHASLCISRRPADRLNECALAAEKALLVRVEYGDKLHFRQVQPLSEQIDAHQHVELSLAEVADDVYTFQRVDVRVHIPHLDAHLFEVVREALRHLLCERGDKHSASVRGDLVDLADEVVHLSFDRFDRDLRIQQSRGTDELFRHLVRAVELVLAGSRGHAHHLPYAAVEFLEVKRSVVVCRRQAESVIHEILLPRAVAVVHAPDLRQSHMALVHETDEFLREKVQQRVRRLPRLSAVEVTGVVLNAGTIPHFPHHLHVVIDALVYALRFDEFAVGAEKLHSLLFVSENTAEYFLPVAAHDIV